MSPDDRPRGPDAPTRDPAAHRAPAAPRAGGTASEAQKPDGVARLVTLWLIVFCSMMGFGITIVPFPVVAEQFGASPFWITWGGTGSFALAQTLATPLLGKLSDRTGRKPVLILGSVGAIVAYFGAAYATSFPALLAARAVAGFASGYLSAAFAYIADISSVDKLARRMGLLGSAFGLGFATGPLLGGILGQAPDGSASLLWPCLFAAGLSTLGLLGTLFAVRESLPPESRRKRGASQVATEALAPGARNALIGVAAAMLAISSGLAALQSLYPIWGRDTLQLSLRMIGAHFAVLSACTALSQLVLIGPAVRRLGEQGVMLLALGGATFGLLLFAFARDPSMVWVADVFCGLSLGLFGPAATSVVSALAPATRRGAILGLFNATGAAGRVVGPAYAGATYALARPAPFLVSAVLIVVTGALVMGHRRRSRRR